MKDRIKKAIDLAVRYGGIDGDHHKVWVIDQMVRALTGCPMLKAKGVGAHGPFEYDLQGESHEYLQLVAKSCSGEDGPSTFIWDVGTPP